MPTNSGIPLDQTPAYVGPGHPFNWLDIGSNEALGLQQSAVMRGHPVPLSYWQARLNRGPQTVAQGAPIYLQSRPFDRGADAYSPKFGQLAYNPIGAGIYSPYKLPAMAGPGARYVYGAIWFDVQSAPTSMQINPTVPIETVNALIHTSHVGASYRTTG